MAFPVDSAKFYAFLVAMFFMAISPGPANLFFVRTGLAGSPWRVFAGVIGTNSASIVWLTASALGLQALMLAFPLAFQAMAVMGGVYLGWLGFKTIRHARHIADEVIDARLTAPAAARTAWQTLGEGFMVQILNPKMVLFLSAVLPPFVDIHRPMPGQMLVFATATVATDVVSMSSYGLLAVRLAHLLHDPRNKQRFDIASGAILMLVAALILGHAASDLLKPH